MQPGQQWTVQMAGVPAAITNAKVCAAKLLGLSMLSASNDEPAFFSVVIDVEGLAAPLEVEPAAFSLLAGALAFRHEPIVVLRRHSVDRPWSYVGLFAEQAALEVAQGLSART